LDSHTLSLLTSEIVNQVEQIKLVYDKLLERDALIERGEPVVFEGAAFHIHNYYSAVEDLLKIVAATFENNIADASRWHSELVDRMVMNVEGVRPRFLSSATAALLHRIRSFRHFFRHAYRVDLDGAEIQINVERVKQVHPLLLADVNSFLKTLSSSEQPGV
jgi:hypothetical protein